jgi:hypothetical protein
MSRGAISRAIDVLLSDQGFERHGNLWIRSREVFWDVIDTQTGRSIAGVTVNIALMHPPTYELAWGKPPVFPPPVADCVVRTRLGLLIDGRDHWWSPNEQSASEITAALADAALPFLTAFNDLASVDDWLCASLANRYPPEALYLAAVKHQLGRDAEAGLVIEQLLQRTQSGPWRERIRGLAVSLT